MDQKILAVFLNQVLIQSKFFLKAADDLDTALNSAERDSVTNVFFALQSMLTSAANISKALWGQGGSRSNERVALRRLIGISDSSAFRDVTMRNTFDHFDERIEKWWQTSTSRDPIDCAVISTDSVVVNSDPINWFRVFEPDTKQLYFWGQQFDVQRLTDEGQKMPPQLERNLFETLQATWLKEHPANHDHRLCEELEKLFLADEQD